MDYLENFTLIMSLLPDNLIIPFSNATLISQLLFWAVVIMSLDEYDSLSTKVLAQQKKDTEMLKSELIEIKDLIRRL